MPPTDRYGSDVLSTDWRAPKRGRATELDALVAYLQVLGTMVDFKIYDDQKNLR